MQIKQTLVDKVIFEAEVNERKYEVHCSKSASLGELHDVLLYFKGWIVDRIKAQHEQDQQVTDFVNNKTDVPPDQPDMFEEATKAEDDTVEEVAEPIKEISPEVDNASS